MFLLEVNLIFSVLLIFLMMFNTITMGTYLHYLIFKVPTISYS